MTRGVIFRRLPRQQFRFWGAIIHLPETHLCIILRGTTNALLRSRLKYDQFLPAYSETADQPPWSEQMLRCKNCKAKKQHLVMSSPFSLIFSIIFLLSPYSVLFYSIHGSILSSVSIHYFFFLFLICFFWLTLQEPLAPKGLPAESLDFSALWTCSVACHVLARRMVRFMSDVKLFASYRTCMHVYARVSYVIIMCINLNK